MRYTANMAHETIDNCNKQLARLGCLKALERFNGCDNIQGIFKEIKELLNSSVRWNQKPGILHIAIDPRTGDVDTQYVDNPA